MSIMEMKSVVFIKNKRSGLIYILGEFVNDVAREITVLGSFATDYINKNTQDEYEIVD